MLMKFILIIKVGEKTVKARHEFSRIVLRREIASLRSQ
jgi:hypothetical protein